MDLRRIYHSIIYRFLGHWEKEVDRDRNGKPVDHRLRETTHELRNEVMRIQGSGYVVKQETDAFKAFVNALRNEEQPGQNL